MTTDKKKFHVSLREAREQRAVSVSTAAKWAVVTEEQWRKFEDGSDVPTVLILKKVFGPNHRILSEIPERPETAVPPPPHMKDAAFPPSPPETTHREFGKALSAQRAAAKMTQDEVAELLNVSKSTIARWEGGSPLIEAHAQQLAELFPVLRDKLPEGRAGSKPGREKGGRDDAVDLLKRAVETASTLRGVEARGVICVSRTEITVLMIVGDTEVERTGGNAAALVRGVLDELRADVSSQLADAKRRADELERLERMSER